MKFISAVVLVALISSCGGGSSTTQTTEPVVQGSTGTTSDVSTINRPAYGYPIPEPKIGIFVPPNPIPKSYNLYWHDGRQLSPFATANDLLAAHNRLLPVAYDLRDDLHNTASTIYTTIELGQNLSTDPYLIAADIQFNRNVNNHCTPLISGNVVTAFNCDRDLAFIYRAAGGGYLTSYVQSSVSTFSGVQNLVDSFQIGNNLEHDGYLSNWRFSIYENTVFVTFHGFTIWESASIANIDELTSYNLPTDLYNSAYIAFYGLLTDQYPTN